MVIMWLLCKCRKLSKSECREHENRDPDDFDDVLAIPQEIIDKEPELYKDLSIYGTVLPMYEKQWDYEKIKKENNIPESGQLCAESPCDNDTCDMHMIFDVNGTSMYVQVPEAVRNEYIITSLKPHVVVKRQVIGSWGDEFKLRDKVCRLYADNCKKREVVRDYLAKRRRKTADGILPCYTRPEIVDEIADSIRKGYGLKTTKPEVRDICRQADMLDKKGYFQDGVIPEAVKGFGYYLITRAMAKALNHLEDYNELGADEGLFYTEMY